MSVKCRRPASGPSFDVDFDFVSWRIHMGSKFVSGDGGVRWGSAMNRRSDCYDAYMMVDVLCQRWQDIAQEASWRNARRGGDNVHMHNGGVRQVARTSGERRTDASVWHWH